MKIIGLCGPSGSGKTVVGQLFAMEGFVHIDCDTLVHEKVYARADVRAALAENFGADILTDSGIDRPKLGTIVFNDSDKLNLLNRIMREAICEEVYAELHRQNAELALVDAPTLFEAGFDKECAAIIGMIAPLNSCVERIMNRDGITREAALKRLSHQKDEQFLRKNCDYILENNGNIVGLTKSALRLADEIKKEYQS